MRRRGGAVAFVLSGGGSLGAVQVGMLRALYILSTGYACQLNVPPRGALGMMLHALTLLIQQRLVRDVESFKGRARLVVLPPPCPLDVNPADFSRAAHLIERALTEARRFVTGSASWSRNYRSPQGRCLPTDEDWPTSSLEEQVLTPAAEARQCAQSAAHRMVGADRGTALAAVGALDMSPAIPRHHDSGRS